MTSPDVTNPAGVDAATLRELLATRGGVRILDVRTPGEFETAHIPGAYNVPLDLLREHGTEFRTHLDDQVVLVCRSGARAIQAGQTLAEAGLPNVKILNGGMTAWQQTDAPVNHGRTRWDLERQVRLVAGLIVASSVLGSLLLPGLQWIAALMGAGLTVAALTNTCAMGMLLAKLPYNRGTNSCDLTTIVGQLRDTGSRP
ncbi:rhodanese-like domain-containing protein [Actinoplanes awajinensis]|uniref:Sulfurtransferase n=1 Tax=Actinoplanes awajinensis subsp. mycoplanecinus TaxID=135947 RepID=A0A101JHH8_9ACTN|nr:rhodanese-like domain-containing protein [Actinoplanes awajinensis]KUL26911.1 sulfurtransferase [Actinoplanes awajinensis subsp. mycoplanecinus]